MKLAELASVENVPALVIGGRWRTGPGMGGPAGQSELAQGQLALTVASQVVDRARHEKLS